MIFGFRQIKITEQSYSHTVSDITSVKEFSNLSVS